MKKVKLVEGDCITVLPQYEEQVGFLFADPPYAISNKANVSNTWNGYTSYKGDWDQVEDYEIFTKMWVQEACRTLIPGGLIAVSGVYGSLVPVFQELMVQGMRFQSHIIWHKRNPAPTVHHRMFSNANEIILVFSNGPRWHFDYARAKEIAGGDPHNVVRYPVARRREGIISKPIGLMKHLIEVFCPSDGLVLDPFAGTGSTLMAAYQLERRVVGIDTNPIAIGVMRKRLQDENIPYSMEGL